MCINDDDDDDIEGPTSPISLQTMPPPTSLTTGPEGGHHISPATFNAGKDLGMDYLAGVSGGGGGGGALEGAGSGNNGPHRGWLDGLLGCLRPVWTIIGKAANNEIKMQGKGK